MTIGIVVGEVYSTINHPFYDARKLLVVEKGLPGGTSTGDYIIAVDTVGAGVGESVLVLDEGNGARQVLQSSDGPVRSVIVGIVDQINVVS
jgi:ethanolamine utilization protein EutN